MTAPDESPIPKDTKPRKHGIRNGTAMQELIPNYYSVDSIERTDGGALFRVTLDPACEVYRGHFPSRAISPGVCNIRMIAECAETLLGKPLRVTEIHRCRFTSLITPADTPRLNIFLNISETDGVLKLKSEITSDKTVCLTLDCTLTEE